MQITLEGNLEYFEITELLQFLGSSNRKGSLKLVAEGKEAEIFLEGSSVIQAHVGGKWSENGEHAVDAIAETLGWRKGTFAFVDSAAHAGRETLTLDMTQLLADGKRRMEDKARSGTRQPDMSVVFRTVDPPQNSEIEMSVKEWKLFSRFDGSKTLDEVLGKADADREESLALVQSLFENKLIVPVAKSAAADSSPKAALAEQTGELGSLPPRPSKPKESKAVEKEARPAEKESAPAVKQARAVANEEKALAETKGATAKEAESVPVPAAEVPSGPIMACLTMDDGDKEMFPLLEDSYTVGRDTKNAIVLADSSVSTMHAKVVRTPEGFVIEDLKSRNGTHVNDERIERKLLSDNDSIRLGRIYLTYNIASEMKASRATMYEVKRPD